MLIETRLAGRLRARLAHRFAEVIVDEYQDSNADDGELIRFLEQAGVSVVMVGDVDQDIYGFRRALPSEAEVLAGLVAEGKALNGNYRSTPAICKLVDSLRFGDSTDLALGEHAHETRPVYVLKTKGPKGVAAKIAVEARRHGFERDRLVVLSHKGSDARQYAGAGNPAKTAFARIERLAHATAVIQNSQAAPHTRAQAMVLFESALRECAGDELSTVHRYKGLQSPAVAVVIPKPHEGVPQEGVSCWDARRSSEAHRVLYVAASRAEQLLMLVVDDSQHAIVIEILDRDEVPCELA